MTRWQKWFLEDDRLPSIPPSLCAKSAAKVFAEHGKRVILDVGCGAGRDAHLLSQHGFCVIGVDAAEAGVGIANRLKKDKQLETVLATADARSLPFADASFEGVYCFGLLHEFTEDTREGDVRAVMREIQRVLKSDGILILAVQSGAPEDGLPHVRLFTERMFDTATRSFRVIDKQEYLDIGCTGCNEYKVWRGVFTKPSASRGVKPRSSAP